MVQLEHQDLILLAALAGPVHPEDELVHDDAVLLHDGAGIPGLAPLNGDLVALLQGGPDAAQGRGDGLGVVVPEADVDDPTLVAVTARALEGAAVGRVRRDRVQVVAVNFLRGLPDGDDVGRMDIALSVNVTADGDGGGPAQFFESGGGQGRGLDVGHGILLDSYVGDFSGRMHYRVTPLFSQ